jgi:hypothetical protein
VSFVPHSISGFRDPFFIFPFGKKFEEITFVFDRSRPQGLATLSADPTLNPGTLISRPTLAGFTLQSFPSFPAIAVSFLKPLPFLRFSTKPVGFVPALQRFMPTGKAVPRSLQLRGLI